LSCRKKTMTHALWTGAQLSSQRRPDNESWGSEQMLVVAICLAAGAIGLRALRDLYPSWFGAGVPDSERKTAKVAQHLQLPF